MINKNTTIIFFICLFLCAGVFAQKKDKPDNKETEYRAARKWYEALGETSREMVKSTLNIPDTPTDKELASLKTVDTIKCAVYVYTQRYSWETDRVRASKKVRYTIAEMKILAEYMVGATAIQIEGVMLDTEWNQNSYSDSDKLPERITDFYIKDADIPKKLTLGASVARLSIIGCDSLTEIKLEKALLFLEINACKSLAKINMYYATDLLYAQIDNCPLLTELDWPLLLNNIPLKELKCRNNPLLTKLFDSYIDNKLSVELLDLSGCSSMDTVWRSFSNAYYPLLHTVDISGTAMSLQYLTGILIAPSYLDGKLLAPNLQYINVSDTKDIDSLAPLLKFPKLKVFEHQNVNIHAGSLEVFKAARPNVDI